MKKDPLPSLPLLEQAINELRKLGFDVQVAKINGQIVFAALGDCRETLRAIRGMIPGIEHMEYAYLHCIGYDNFKEAQIFMVNEKHERGVAV